MAVIPILIVEDDTWYAKFLQSTLAKEGFEACVINNGETLFQTLEGNAFEAVVLDLGLPDEDGIVLARKLRARSRLPIIIVTGREELDDKLASFDVGADDYVNKPVEPKELAARLKAVIGRANETGRIDKDEHNVNGYTIDMQRRNVTGPDGKALDLTPAEFSMLAVFCHAEGNVLSRDDLIDAVSTGEGPLSSRAVDILVSRIRKKLGKEIIETVTGSGYRIALNTGVDGVGRN